MEADYKRAPATVANPAPPLQPNQGDERDKDPGPEQSEREHRFWKFRLRPDDDDEPQLVTCLPTYLFAGCA